MNAAGGGDRADGGAERAAALERRYRRLLRCYPPSHRQVHREEMLGVLLAAARSGQRVPGAAQTVNLVACGLAIRARRALSWLADDPSQDALAVVSLIAPVVMLIIAALNFAAAVRESVAIDYAYPPTLPFWTLNLVPFLGGPAAMMIGWLAVASLGLTGRRRAAAATASLPLALALVNLLVEVMQLSGAWSGGLPMFLWTAGLVSSVALASLAACSLAFSAGPRAGLAIVGRRRACLMIAGLGAGFGFPGIARLVSPATALTVPAFSFLAVLAIAVAVTVTRVRGITGWRVAGLAVTGLMLYLASTFPLTGDLTASVVLSLGDLLFAVLVWPVAIVSWKGRGRRTSRAG